MRNSLYDEKNKKYFIEKYKLDGLRSFEKRKLIYDNIVEVCKFLDYSRKIIKLFEKYKKMDELMFDFFFDMRSPKKDIIFPNKVAKKYLNDLIN